MHLSVPALTRHLLTLLGAVWLSVPAASYATPAESELRPLNGEVTAVTLRGPIDLTLNQGETRGLQLDGKPDERARVKLELVNGELQISLEGQGGFSWWSPHSPLRASLTLPVLRRLHIQGSGDAALGAFDLKEGELKVDVTGSGDVKINRLSAGTLRTRIMGSGDIQVAGRVMLQDLSIAGSGDYDASGLKSQTAAIAIRGSGDVDVDATETLEVDIAGSGDVRYSGQPKLIKRIRGSGELTRRE